ncbi:MAG: hypothetical protein HYZ47_02945, partial [Simkania negevensis]|nr:hypothetical protein [Simkania negevensis]
MKRKAFVLLCLFFLTNAFSASPRTPIEDPSLLSLGMGIFNVVRGAKTTNFQLEFRSSYPFYRNYFLFVRPLVGAMATATGSGYFYGGVAFDFFLSPQVVFT